MVRKSLADAVDRRKVYKKHGIGTEGVKKNPFEFKYNKTKHAVLGKKSNTLRSGAPGASRKKADEIRQKRLLPEFRRFGKANRIKDKRAGEADSDLTKEERLARRFAMEREKRFKKSSHFALDEDEELTHYGQSLAEIETFERPEINEEEEERGMNADFVNYANFGGGQSKMDDESQEKRSRKDIIQEMIANSKKLRFEKYQQKEENVSRTEDLDDKWKELVQSGKFGSLISKDGNRRVDVPEPEQEKEKSYDFIVNELRFDSKRVKAVDKLKTPEEIAKAERDKLQQLEAERIARMKGESLESEENQSTKPTHISADDDIDELPSTHSSRGKRLGGDFVVAYKDGVLVQSNAVGNDAQVSDDEEGEGESEEGSDEESYDEGEDMDFGQEEDNDDTSASNKPEHQSNTETTGELPYVFAMPKTYQSLANLFNKYPAPDSGKLIIERLIKNYHPGLNERNKELLGNLFLHTLRYFDFNASHEMNGTGKKLDGLIKGLYQLAKVCPDHAVRFTQALLKSHRKQINGKNKRRHPGMNFIAFLRCIQALFPVSDLRHPIVTPAISLACKALLRARNKTPKDVAKGLLLIAAIIPYFSHSKRYSPEVVSYLLSVLHVSLKNEPWEKAFCPSFPISEPHRWMLFVEGGETSSKETPKVSASTIYSENDDLDDESLKVACINTCCSLILKLTKVYTELPSYREILEHFLRKLKRLPVDNYPIELRENIAKLVATIEESLTNIRRTFLGGKTEIQKGFQFLEPRIDTNFDPERYKKRDGGPTKGPKAEKKKLTKLYKREVRSTIRELRKDNQFLAREVLRDAEAKDHQRKEKTKKLMQGLMGQESEYKKYQREKDKDRLKAKKK